MKNIRTFFISVLVVSLAGVAWANPDSDIPVEPIMPSVFAGWTNALRLKNDKVEVIIVPEIGRIAQVLYEGSNEIFNLDPKLLGYVPGKAGNAAWFNFGGDWFWPVAQSRWISFAGKDWPPPPVLGDIPWEVSAWKCAEGALCCQLSREYGPPLFLKASRLIKLGVNDARITIRQRIERTGKSSIPAVLWNISQINKAGRIIMGTDNSSAFKDGFKTMMFGRPGPDVLFSCDGTLVYEAGTGEHKIGSDSRRAWVAAQKGRVLLIEKAEGDQNGRFPDGGCTVEMYSNAGLGYSEIETLSVEKNLQPGESMQNTLTLECIPTPAGAGACKISDRVRSALGEKTGE